MLKLFTANNTQIPLTSIVCKRYLDRIDRYVVHVTSSLPSLLDIYGLRENLWQISFDEETLIEDLILSDFISSTAIALRPKQIPSNIAQYRIHSGYTSLLTFFESSKFTESLKINDGATRNELEEVKLIEGFKRSNDKLQIPKFIFQNGLTDIDFLRYLIAQWNYARPQKPIALSWQKNGWQIVGSWQRKERPANMLELSGDSWKVTDLIGQQDIDLHTKVPTINFTNLVAKFDKNQWQDQLDSPLPHLLLWQDRYWLAGERQDILKLSTGGDGGLEWTINLRATLDVWYEPRDLNLCKQANNYIITTGQVVSCDDKQTVSVNLDMCASTEEKLVCYFTTPSAGSNHKQGLHMVPSPKARVLIAVADGLQGGNPLCLCEIRENNAEYPSPSISFSELVTIQSKKGVKLTDFNNTIAIKDNKINMISE